MVINKKEMPESLLDMIIKTQETSNNNNVIKFSDNSRLAQFCYVVSTNNHLCQLGTPHVHKSLHLLGALALAKLVYVYSSYFRLVFLKALCKQIITFYVCLWRFLSSLFYVAGLFLVKSMCLMPNKPMHTGHEFFLNLI